MAYPVGRSRMSPGTSALADARSLARRSVAREPAARRRPAARVRSGLRSAAPYLATDPGRAAPYASANPTDSDGYEHESTEDCVQVEFGTRLGIRMPGRRRFVTVVWRHAGMV